MKYRLLTVQGPLQFLTGYIAYRWQRPPAPDVEDILLLYDFFVAPEIEARIAEAVRELAAAAPWVRIVQIDGADMSALMRTRYSRSIRRIRSRIGVAHFDEIYLSRDYLGHGSPLLLNAYPEARKVVYGDSFGLMGQKESVAAIEAPANWRDRLKLAVRRRLFGEPCTIAVDDAVLSLPIDMTGRALDGIPLSVPSREHVVACLEQIYRAQPELRAYCESLREQGRSGASHLYLLSNLTASGLSEAKQEVDLYLEVIRATSPSGGTVYIKPHPRSAFEMLQTLARELANSYDVIVVDDARFARMPVELWIDLMRHCEVVAIFSTSSINLKYLFNKNVILAMTDARIARYIKPLAQSHITLLHQIMSEAIANLDNWDGQSVLWQPH